MQNANNAIDLQLIKNECESRIDLTAINPTQQKNA